MITPNHNSPALARIELDPKEIRVCESGREWVARLRHSPHNPGLRIRPLLDLDQWFTSQPQDHQPLLVWEYHATALASDWQALQRIGETNLVFAVGGLEMMEQAAWLRALGIAALFPGVLSAERLLRLAARHFDTIQRTDKLLEDRIQAVLPWS